MKTHETKNWSELAMILTARLRLQYICTGAADKRCAAFLMEIMQRSGEADPAAALSYMVMADSAAGDDVLRRSSVLDGPVRAGAHNRGWRPRSCLPAWDFYRK